MRNRLYIFYWVILIFSGCNSGNQHELIISGKIADGVGKTIFLNELRIKETITLDSVRLTNQGEFEFRVRAGERSFYLLKADQGNFLSLIAGPGEEITLDASYDDLSGTARIEGSDESALYHRFEMITTDNLKKVDSLGRQLMAFQGHENFPAIKDSLTARYAEVFDTHRRTVQQIIQANPSSLTSLLMLNRWFGRSPVFQAEPDSQLFFMVDSALMARYPENTHVKEQHQKMEALRDKNRKRYEIEKNLMSGSIPPDILLPDPARQMHQLSALKGKPVILFFWTSESKESMKAAGELLKFYKAPGSRQAEIFAVSFDSSRNQWEAAIRSLQLKWINVSDLQGIASPIAERYGLAGDFPVFFLIGADGKIVLRSSDVNIIISEL